MDGVRSATAVQGGVCEVLTLQYTWRSLFWNITAGLILLLMTLIATMVAFGATDIASNVIFGVLAAVMWVGVVRTFTRSVTARPDGIVMRKIERTVTIPWSEVIEIRSDHFSSGPSGMLGATTPVVIRKSRQGRDNERIELNVLASYGLITPTPGDRAIQGLNACFEEWKRKQQAGNRSHQ